jgi:hypothetical protein
MLLFHGHEYSNSQKHVSILITVDNEINAKAPIRLAISMKVEQRDSEEAESKGIQK